MKNILYGVLRLTTVFIDLLQSVIFLILFILIHSFDR